MPIQYYMRAYKTTSPTGYVDWIVNDQPDSAGTYSGYNPSDLINITVNRVVQSKIENFLKANNTTDGYFFHLNSIDWIHPTPPGPPIPVPSQITGLAVVRGSTDGYARSDYATMFWDESSGAWKFAYNTNGDGYTVGASLPVAIGAAIIDGYLALGTNPADDGIIRIPNSQIIQARNSTNDGNVPLVQANVASPLNQVEIGSVDAPALIPLDIFVGRFIAHSYNYSSGEATDGFIRASNGDTIISVRNNTDTDNMSVLTSISNTILLGDSQNEGVLYAVGSGWTHSFIIDGIYEISIGADGSSNPIIYQPDQTIGNGKTFTIQAQNTIDPGNTGGALILKSGKGNPSTANDGYVQINSGDTPYLYMVDNEVVHFVPSIVFDVAVASPNLTQALQVIGDGQQLSIAAQSTVAVGNTGGILSLASGSGDNYGTVDIKTGSDIKLRISTNEITSYTSPFAFDSAVSAPTIKQNDSTFAFCEQFLISAQSTSSIVGTGGDLSLTSGSGAVASGVLTLQLGGNTALLLSNNDIDYGSVAILSQNSLLFNGYYVTNPLIGQAHNSTPSFTGQTLTIAAQTADAGYGGNLILASGSGSISDGLIRMQSGSTTYVTSGIDGYGPYFSLGFAPAVTGAFRVSNNIGAIIARNNADNDDIYLIGTDSADNIIIGDASNTTIITGDLTVLGTTTTINSTVVDIADRVIHLNHTTGIVPAPTLIAGVSIHRGSADGYTNRDHSSIIWDEIPYLWKFASINQGDDLTINNMLPVAASRIDIMATPTSVVATSGAMNVANNVVGAAARHSSGIGDIPIWSTDASDTVQFGSLDHNTRLDGYNIQIDAGIIAGPTGSVTFNTIGSTDHIYFDGSGNKLFIDLSGPQPYLKAQSGGYIDLPGGYGTFSNNFAINSVHVDGYVTANNLSTLCNGSNADALHTHSGANIAVSISCGSYTSITGNYDGYLMPDFTASSSELPVYLVNSNGTLKDLRVSMQTPPGIGEDIIFTVRVSGADSSITTTVSGTNTTGSDTVNSIAVVAGDLVSIRILTSASAAPANIIASLNIV